MGVQPVTGIHRGIYPRVAESIRAMSWLIDSDGAMVELALVTARAIDAAVRKNDIDQVAKLGPQMASILKSLGGTPGDRKSLMAEGNPRGRLAELRASRVNDPATMD
jgi:hypothetical protein